MVAGSNPTEIAWKPWQFPLPNFASVFRKRNFYLVSMTGEVKDHTQGENKCVTCRGRHSSTWSIMPNDHNSVKVKEKITTYLWQDSHDNNVPVAGLA